MSDNSVRNIEKDGVLINLLFFCRALGIKKPVHLDNPVGYMENVLAETGGSWDEVAAKVKILREEYKNKRRISQKKRKDFVSAKDSEVFREFNRSTPKYRNCLSCEVEFFSKHGNRICESCKQNHSAFME